MTETKFPQWDAPGIEPPDQKKKEGWMQTEKPPADWFNWLFHTNYKALQKHDAEIQQSGNLLTNHIGSGGNSHTLATNSKAGFMSPEQVEALNVYSKYRSVLDVDTDIYTQVDYKRPDNTLYMRSILSNKDTNGNYLTNTRKYYNAAGTDVTKTGTVTITYNENNIPVNEVIKWT